MRDHAIALACCYFAVLVISAVVWLLQELARALSRRKYRVRVVTIGPSLSRAFRQQPRPIARGEVDMPPARRSPMGDPMRIRRSSGRC